VWSSLYSFCSHYDGLRIVCECITAKFYTKSNYYQLGSYIHCMAQHPKFWVPSTIWPAILFDIVWLHLSHPGRWHVRNGPPGPQLKGVDTVQTLDESLNLRPTISRHGKCWNKELFLDNCRKWDVVVLAFYHKR